MWALARAEALWVLGLALAEALVVPVRSALRSVLVYDFVRTARENLLAVSLCCYVVLP